MKAPPPFPGMATALTACLLLAACQRTADTEAGTRAADAPGQASAVSAASAAAGSLPGSGLAHSLPVAPASATTPDPGELDAGARLAAQGSGAATACVACHGAQGEGQPNGPAPRLAGQGWAYLDRQLAAYAEGSRPHPVMSPIAQALQPVQRRQLAAYFASLSPQPPPETDPRRPSDGPAATLALVGEESRRLMACANCHGRDGSGLGERIPPLAAQPAAYLEAALAAWREDRRRTDPSGEMPRIAKALQPAEAQALSAWYAALPLPPSAARRAPPFSSRLPALSSGPVTAADSTRGIGSEQGSPLTGSGIGTTQPLPAASRPR